MSKKQIIIKAATRLFSEKGFKETSVAELSKVTGAAEGTIFHHFKTKEDIFLSILKNVKEGIIEEFEEYIHTRAFDNGLDMMEGVISFYLYLAGRMEEWFLLLHRHYPYELAMDNPVCREYLEGIYTCLVDIFEEAISRGQKDASIDNGVPSRKTAMIIFAMVNGLVWFKLHHLYEAGALYNELIASCHKILRESDECKK
ncbi:TetR/AcrR family transcriptional regulator [Desulfonema magnum]|uniref:DNA-binding HTH domain-containing protein, TetR-type n=1 Tax=Desulfonema magnum TaxID=45655 RepID=A0A975GSQ2_9BACT|nr:TetR/AcrR family transcriptional regulator [Desulfonema magnum]QTA92306.1 DNA-binding HTH domain-containing protein, TetR-type [Desulfonema magnum]